MRKRKMIGKAFQEYWLFKKARSTRQRGQTGFISPGKSNGSIGVIWREAKR